MGFIEETGAAQFARDVRVSAIYEGTTGIQGADLVGRKLSDGGAAAFALLGEAAGDRGAPMDSDRAGPNRSLRCSDATRRLLAMELNDRLAGSVPYARAIALTLGGHYHLEGRDGRA
jgi:acyl-CoA dehydrogenase